MPLLTSTPPAVGSLTVDIGALAFNRDRTAKVHTLDGWWDTVALDAPMVASGGAGAVATGPWLPKERYVTVAGHFLGTDPFVMRRTLLAEFTPGVDTPVTVAYPDGTTEQLLLRPYDRFDITPKGNQLRFTLPLVALDPWKYRADPLTGDFGVFTGQTWFREYDPTSRHYALDGSWVRHYEQAVPSGPYPPSVTLSSNGDATSRRVVVTVTGPVTVGEWWLLNETTGEQLWVDVTVAAGQQLVLDSRTRTARLNGSPVDHLVFGDFPTLVPGDNLFRLVSGTQSDAYASVEAFEAFQ